MLGIIYYNILSDQEKIKFQHNLNQQYRSDIVFELIHPDFESFISSSFIWGDTEEGFEYWCDISRRYDEVDFKPNKDYKKFVF